MAKIQTKPLFGSNRGFRLDTIITTELQSDTIVFPDNISFITTTMIIPAGVKAKIQTSTIDEDKLTTPIDNLDVYWVNFDLNGEPVQDINGFITGPEVVQGSIPVVNGMRIVRETGSAEELLMGIRAQ